MSRLELRSPNQAQLVVEGLYKDLERRIESSPPGLCPVDMARKQQNPLWNPQTVRLAMRQPTWYTKEPLDLKMIM